MPIPIITDTEADMARHSKAKYKTEHGLDLSHDWIYNNCFVTNNMALAVTYP